MKLLRFWRMKSLTQLLRFECETEFPAKIHISQSQLVQMVQFFADRLNFFKIFLRQRQQSQQND